MKQSKKTKTKTTVFQSSECNGKLASPRNLRRALPGHCGAWHSTAVPRGLSHPTCASVLVHVAVIWEGRGETGQFDL